LCAAGSWCGADAQATPCLEGPSIDAKSAELGRYLFELRNNRQVNCSPPDYVGNPDDIISYEGSGKQGPYGFKVVKVCAQVSFVFIVQKVRLRGLDNATLTHRVYSAHCVYASQPEMPPPTVAVGTTSTLYDVTVTFNDPCSKGAAKQLTLQARVWDCLAADDVLMQPAVIETIQARAMPANCTIC
jgi:hypothetical protein